MFRYLLITITILILAGCAAPVPPLSQGSWETQQAQLKQLTHWQVTGQIAFFTPKQRHSASLYWNHQSGSDHLVLSGPFGHQLLNARIRPENATIDTNGKTYLGPDATELFHELTGWKLPINRLPNWLQGLPVDASYQLNKQQRIRHLTSHDGWHITYQRYQKVGRYILPSRLTAVHGDVRIKVFINQWQLD
ncbi:MAG: Outer-membrane lipoprotein LolB [Candidatus Celerinatantimonas neptuna]|nr:MAG: Outer-membrane lipoprotein LolB [Candidatus Celerinatantimonas neptuna]